MLGAPRTEKTVSIVHKHAHLRYNSPRTELHKHDHTLSYPWTYVAPLLVHSPHSLSMCKRGEMQKTDKQDDGKCVQWKRERRKNDEIKIHFLKTASCPLQHKTQRDASKESYKILNKKLAEYIHKQKTTTSDGKPEEMTNYLNI